jgi:hypothetical protein
MTFVSPLILRITRDFYTTPFVQLLFHKMTFWPWPPDTRQTDDKVFWPRCLDIRHSAGHKECTILTISSIKLENLKIWRMEACVFGAFLLGRAVTLG